MSIVNFSIPAKLDQQIKKTIKEKGFASKAEFFRFAALYTLGNIAPTKSLDTIIREAEADYEAGNYQSARSAKQLLRKLKQ
ncbi:MAG TPA: ribbon-helix-helix domain-containing protein [Patescibacteria group bacterium]|nr:ribbon-helix-helix domain-containing protein [Patescibacteria group bacterium]